MFGDLRTITRVEMKLIYERSCHSVICGINNFGPNMATEYLDFLYDKN